MLGLSSRRLCVSSWLVTYWGREEQGEETTAKRPNGKPNTKNQEQRDWRKKAGMRVVVASRLSLVLSLTVPVGHSFLRASLLL